MYVERGEHDLSVALFESSYDEVTYAMVQRFSVGVRFKFDEAEYEVRQQLPASRLNVVLVSTGEFSTFTMDELATAAAKGELKFVSNGQKELPPLPVLNLDDYPERSVTIARRHLDLIETTLDLHGRACQDAIKAIVDAHPADGGNAQSGAPSERSLYRWRRAYLNSGRDFRSLIPNLHQKGNRKKHRTNEESERILQITVEDLRGGSLRRPLDQIYREYKLRVHEENRQRPASEQLPIHSRATVGRRVRELDPEGSLLSPRTTRKSRGQRRQLGKMEYPEFPLERVEMDNTPLDIILVNDHDTSTPLGRPWMTVMIDTATRCVLAFVVSMNPPSYATVMQCIHQAILPKPDTRSLYGTKNEWKSYGVPHLLVIDNGKDYRTKDLEHAALTLNMGIEYSPPRTPEDKGAVERLFGTLQTQLVHTLPGATFSNPRQLGDYDSVKEATLTLPEFERQLHLWCVDIYSQSMHGGLEAIPSREWDRHIEAGFFPRVPDVSSRELTIILGRSADRVIQPSGIQFEGLTFNSQELGPLRLNLEARGQSARVKLKYDPRDLGQLFVFDPLQNRYLMIPAVDYEYATGRTLWQHRVVKKYRSQQADVQDDIALAESLREIHAIVDESVDAGASKTHKREARWMQDSNAFTTQDIPMPDESRSADVDAYNEEDDSSTINDHSEDYLVDMEELENEGWALRLAAQDEDDYDFEDDNYDRT